MDDPARRSALARRFALRPHGKRWDLSRSVWTVGRAAGAAAAFLTRVPGLARFRYDGPDLVRSAPVFPVIGAAVGALVGATVLAGTWLGIPRLLAATLAVAVGVVATGALHLDGLADSADGLAGSTPERKLQIMRGADVGVYGITAVVLDLLITVTAVAELPRSGVLPTLIAVYAVARAAPLPLAAGCRYAGGTGTGREFVERMRWSRAIAGLAVAAVIAGAAAGAAGLSLLGALALVVYGIWQVSRRRLGGVTGDVLGAAVELTAVACLLVAHVVMF